MKQINSPADFEAMLRAEWALAFVVLNRSAWAEEFERVWAPKLKGSYQRPDGRKIELYVLSPDQHPYTWKWVNQVMDTLGVNEFSADWTVQLKKGAIIDGVSDTGQSFNREVRHNGIDAGLLKILCCPETHQELTLAAPAILGKLNGRIAEGHLQNRAGRVLRDKIDAGLVRADGRWLYPVRENIPVLLVDESVPLSG